ncbi:MAG: type II secretion system F family protein [Phycisphaerae bacterium]|jgi:type IV pilus assembly protein PilC
MPSYRFTVRSSSGQVSSGSLAAESVAAAAATLRGRGLHVVSIGADSSGKSLLERFRDANTGRPSDKHILDFTTQLAVMIRAGINLRSALDGIAQQTTHPGLKRVLDQLKTDVESGQSFSASLAKHPTLFNPLYLNMVKASEMSGGFSKMLDRIAEYMNQQIETRKMVIGASIYPAVIGTLAIGVTIFLLVAVLPKFAGVFEGKESVLPWSTKFLLAVSAFMIKNWMFLAAAAVGVVGGVYAFLRTEVGIFWFDRFRLAVPIIRTMFRSLYISRSLQTMGQLINAGVPMLDTLMITGEISGNIVFKTMWRKVHAAVKAGNKISKVLVKDSVLPPAVTQMISAGEESGKLGEVLDEVSAYYGKQLKDNIKTATGLIEPIMILFMGAVVGFIAMSIILPIFKMSSIVK